MDYENFAIDLLEHSFYNVVVALMKGSPLSSKLYYKGVFIMDNNDFYEIIKQLNQEQIGNLIDYAIELKKGEDN